MYLLKILPFIYDGFFVRTLGKKPVAEGIFVKKTEDPGIVLIELTNHEELRVPTCALIGQCPKVTWKPKPWYVGPPSALQGKPI